MTKHYDIPAASFDTDPSCDSYKTFLNAVDDLYEILWQADLTLTEDEQAYYFGVLQSYIGDYFKTYNLPTRPLTESANYNMCILIVGFYWCIPNIEEHTKGFWDKINVTVEI